jgi:signal transduction histidine kinase/CheY-like chemotaxis protein
VDWTFTPYQLPLAASALIALAVAGLVARRRERVGTRRIAWVMLALALWSACNAMELAVPTLGAKLLCDNLAYVGIVSVPVLWALFAMEYSIGGRHLSTRHTAPLSIVPIITLILVWTSPYHGLMHRSIRLDAWEGVVIVARDAGPWFYVHTVYSYLLMLSSSVLLLRVLVRSPHLYRRQAMALLVASLLPLLANAVYLAAPCSVIPMDITPMSFAVTGMVVAYGLGRYGLLDVVPAARDAVVEGMRDGLLVMDAENRVVDMNEAAEGILRKPRVECTGVAVSDLLPATAELLQTRTQKQEDIELPLEPQGARCCYELRISALYDGRGRLTGRLTVLRDVTLQRRAEQEREALHREVERRVQQLAVLATELTQAEERERRRLAQILHDHLQQLLVGAKLHVIALQERVERQDLAADLRDIVAMLEQSIAASRALTVELSPPVLYEGTLAQALAWLARWVQERHGLTVVTRLEPHAEPAGDDVRILLFQAARELLFNVVKHARVEHAFIGMRLVDHAQIELVVADEGVGFHVPAPEDAFEAASGFGLFSIRERLQLLGGRMEIVSSPQKGTRIALYAPASPVPVSPPISPEAPQPATLAPPPADAEISVLLVDDHRTVREGLAALLRGEAGIRVVGEATNGPVALELAARLHPDVVVMDVTLPGMSGIEVTRRLRARSPEVRVVGLSAHAEPSIAGAMRAAGAETYLEKDVPAETLIAAIRGHPPPLARASNSQL